MRLRRQNVTTDAKGLAVVSLKKPQKDEFLQVDGMDKDGEKASAPVPLPVRSGDEQVLLRTEKAIYRAGDSIRMRILTTKKRGTVYIDVVKDGQTFLRDLDLTEGHGELTLAAGPELAGLFKVDPTILFACC